METRTWQVLRNLGLVVAVGGAFTALFTWWLADYSSLPSVDDPYNPSWSYFWTIGVLLGVTLGGILLAVLAQRPLDRSIGIPRAPEKRWMTLRNVAGFVAVLGLLLALFQWYTTGEPWAPSQCDHDGTPISECPDYGYHGDQFRSLWIAGAYALVTAAGLVAAIIAQRRLKKAVFAKPAQAPPVVNHNDPLSRRLLWGAFAALGLAVVLNAFSWDGNLFFAYAGIAMAVGGGMCAILCLVRPRTGIVARWASVLVIAAAFVAGMMNFAVLALSGMV